MRKLCSEVYSLRYASSLLNEAKKASATALSCGRAVAENDSSRVEYYKQLKDEFQGAVIAYITGDRPGFETRIAQDVIDLFIAQLDKIGPVERIVLYLYTRGGDTSAAWNIVNLLRMYCEDLLVVVPHKAHSAGTIISLGANKIIMTKQATLSPIDPSLNSPMNPIIPNDPAKQTTPVSVEAVKGYIELAKDEFGISDGNALSDVLIKLSEYVHPLVLGQVYRSRAQIKMLAGKLLKNQVADDGKVSRIIDFLCSDSGSHDYTINRREAAEELELNVAKPTSTQYEIIKNLYDDFSQELGLGQIFDPKLIQGAYAVRRGFIESVVGGSDFFVTEGRCSTVTTPNGPAIQVDKTFEGWRHDESVDNQQTARIMMSEGEVKYEQDNEFKL